MSRLYIPVGPCGFVPPFLMLSGVLFILLAFIILEDNFLFKICPLADAKSPEDKTGT